ncbi:MAG TPA: hypothetical protein DC034_08290, partial [Clostridium sp.]|nr:hypothetical protein [Clostridium sp.]
GYSLEVLKNYPDLELYISLVDESEVEYSSKQEMLIRKRLIEKLDELKDMRKPKFKRLTYGIEEIGNDGQPIDISQTCKKKPEDFNKKLVRQYLLNKFEKRLIGIATVTANLQEYKKDENGKSYIGAISIDGNQMGKMVDKISNFKDLKDFSKVVDEIYFDAIIEALKEYKKRTKVDSLIITPVLQAGDDICLIVEAEYAIEIAAGVIKKIEVISKMDKYKNMLSKFTELDYLTACGGIAIVRYSYPFFEAVKIAENLCNRAKESVYLTNSSDKGYHRKSFIDWEIVQSQVNTGIAYEMYVKNQNIKEKYHIKPLCIDQFKPLEDGIFSYD